MVFETFTALVGFLALAYAGAAKYLQTKLTDKSEMEAVQAESRRLNEDFEKAKKANDKKRMDRIMQQQMEFLPKMNSVMMKQFRPMIFILVIFAGAMWVVGMLDPFTKDDIVLNLADDGAGCDRVAGDGVFSACYKLGDANYGKWTVSAKAYESGNEVADNQTYFLYNPHDENDTYTEMGKGEGLELATDKRVYYPDETVTVTAIPANMTKGASFIVPIAAPRALRADKVQATLSNGTYFRVDLPLAIPIIDVKSIYQPYWWFIFVSLIANLGATFVMNQFQKKKKGSGGERKA
jgi:hypothetical protein